MITGFKLLISTVTAKLKKKKNYIKDQKEIVLKTLVLYIWVERETEERDHNTASTKIQNQLVSKQITVITGGVGACIIQK